MNRVVVVGSINVDQVVRVPRLPQPGETVAGGEYSFKQGGKGANQAVAIARLGGDVVLVAAIGKDEIGRQAIAELILEGVRLSTVQKGSPTGVALIMVDDNGENMIAVASGANHALGSKDIELQLVPLLTESTIVLSNLEVPYETVLAAARLAHDHNCKFILNPAPALPLTADLLQHVNFLIPNEHEVNALGFNEIRDCFHYGVEAVIVTRGAQGADLIQADGSIHHQDAFPINVKDTTGAGDAFVATFTWAVSNGKQITESLRLAVAAGALATRRLGARSGLASQSELLSYFLEV